MYKEKLNYLHQDFKYMKKYSNKFHNTRARSTHEKKMTKKPRYQSSFHKQENITRNSTIPEFVLHAEKYNTKLHNTRARSTRGKI